MGESGGTRGVGEVMGGGGGARGFHMLDETSFYLTSSHFELHV